MVAFPGMTDQLIGAIVRACSGGADEARGLTLERWQSG